MKLPPWRTDWDALNRERRDATSDALEVAYAQVEALDDLPALLVVADESIRPGVAGLVAGRLAERYRRPAVALSLSGEYAVASARSIPGFSIIDAIRSIEGMLTRYGGHSQSRRVHRRAADPGPSGAKAGSLRHRAPAGKWTCRQRWT